MRLLPALCAAAEVNLWTDQEHWQAELEAYATVRRFDAASIDWAALNSVDATFYNIGNNSQFHGEIWRMSRRHPGFAIMHDVFLHDSVAHDCRVRHDRAAYLELMQSVYGTLGRRDAEWHWDGVLGLDPMSALFLRSVHPAGQPGRDRAFADRAPCADAGIEAAGCPGAASLPLRERPGAAYPVLRGNWWCSAISGPTVCLRRLLGRPGVPGQPALIPPAHLRLLRAIERNARPSAG